MIMIRKEFIFTKKQKILEILEEHIKKDRSKIQIIGFTPLDLLEVTRKHMCSND